MTTELFANLATTTLGAAITTTGATTCTVASSGSFPAAATGVSQFRFLIDTEIMICTNVSGTTWTILRGQEGTTAAVHANAAPIYGVLTVASLAAVASNATGTANNPVTSASAARPSNLTKVFWQCATQPTNWVTGDEWINNS